MSGLNRNIIVENFQKAVADFNPLLLRDKTQYEVISIGLNIYKNIPGCKSATLFLLNQEDFDFYYKSSTIGADEPEIKKVFSDLVTDGEVANALNNGELYEPGANYSEKYRKGLLLIPLIVPTGIIGLCLLIMEDSNTLQENIATSCRIFSNYFAQLISSYDLVKEICSLKESTEQKIALRTNDYVQSTREIKAILDAVQVGIIITEKSTNKIADVNSTATRMLELSKDKLIGTSKQSYFLLNNLNTSPDKFVTSCEGLLKKNNGSLIPVILTTAVITLGDEVYNIDSFIDISERKKMEDALHKAHYELELKVEERTLELSKANKELQKQINERIKAEEEKLKLYWAVQQSPISIAITDLDGDIEYVNPQFTEMTGYSSEEVIGKNSFAVKSVDVKNSTLEKIKKVLIRGNKWHGEVRNKKKSGEVFWVSSFISPLGNMKGEISNYLEVDEDITEKKKAEINLLTAKEKAEESDKLKSSLLSNMSHEFRTPLSGIMGLTQILMNEIAEPSQSEMVKDIYASGKRLMDTLNGILNLSRFDVIKTSANVTITNLSEFFEEIITPYEDLAKDKFLKFRFEILRKQLYTAIEPDLLKQAIGYIIDNAIKFTPEGSVTVVLDSVYENNEKWAAIIIRDTGIGISQNNLQIIFEAFRQASEGFNRKYEGIGLGLTLADRIVKIMNGKIKVESILSKGSTFTILIPLKE